MAAASTKQCFEPLKRRTMLSLPPAAPLTIDEADVGLATAAALRGNAIPAPAPTIGSIVIAPEQNHVLDER